MRTTPPSYCGDLKSAELSFLMNYNQEFVGIFHRYPTLFWDIKRGASIKFLDSVCGFLITDVQLLVTWPYLN